jgi:hypothetical protein
LGHVRLGGRVKFFTFSRCALSLSTCRVCVCMHLFSFTAQTDLSLGVLTVVLRDRDVMRAPSAAGEHFTS